MFCVFLAHKYKTPSFVVNLHVPFYLEPKRKISGRVNASECLSTLVCFAPWLRHGKSLTYPNYQKISSFNCPPGSPTYSPLLGSVIHSHHSTERLELQPQHKVRLFIPDKVLVLRRLPRQSISAILDCMYVLPTGVCRGLMVDGGLG